MKNLIRKIVASEEIITDKIISEEVNTDILNVRKPPKLNKKILLYFGLFLIVQFAIMAFYVAYRPGFLKVKNTPEQIADLSKNFNDFAKETREWHRKKDKRDSITDMKMEYIPIEPSIDISSMSKVSSDYGSRIKADGTTEFHKAVDIRAKIGTPVYAKGSGTIINAKYTNGYGNQVAIRHRFGYMSYYSHLDSIFVKVDQEVKQGLKIGTVGITGNTTGPHLDLRITFMGNNYNPRVFSQL
jgi:murein DD-endopeptidase MepM/ murein hydrolase activator NlpD